MTAVNWLDEQLQDTMHIQYGYIDGVRKVVIPLEDYMRLKQEALVLEKQQMCDFFREGYMWCNSPSLHIHNGKVITSTVKYGELYYDRKFKKD